MGFPGETEEEFRQSMEFVDKVDFYETHIFKYSKREGTKAAAMDDQVSEQVKARRSAGDDRAGREKEESLRGELYRKRSGSAVEEPAEIDGRKSQVGHTKEYMKIALDRQENLKNCVVKVQIDNDSQIIH